MHTTMSDDEPNTLKDFMIGRICQTASAKKSKKGPVNVISNIYLHIERTHTLHYSVSMLPRLTLTPNVRRTAYMSIGR